MTHHHHHHHHHDEPANLTFEEKLDKILTHWKKHNDDHAATYDDWASRCKAHDQAEVSSLLNEVAHMTRQINALFDKASALVKRADK